MTAPPRGPTMIALRARRQAYHIATDILYEEPIDLRTVYCFGCGARLDVPRSRLAELACAQCGSPLELAAHVKPPLLRYAEWIPIDLPDRCIERLVAEIEHELDDTAGIAVAAFTLLMGVLIGAALFFLA